MIMAGAQNDDPAGALMLDDNVVAGELQAVFGSDMTGNDAECASCGKTHAMGRFWRSPADRESSSAVLPVPR